MCVVVLLGSIACARLAPRPEKPAGPPRPTLGVETQREDLQVTPWELVFSGVRGEAGATDFVGIKNGAAAPVEIRALEIGGDPKTFRIAHAPPLPLVLAPGKQASVEIAFAPTADAEVGVRRGVLRIGKGPLAEDILLVDLAALVTRGVASDAEPPLALVVDALGYGMNVGGKDLVLGTAPTASGQEIAAPRFVRAKPAPVGLYAVARYSPDGRIPYGLYKADGGKPVLEELAVIAEGQNQRLHPELEPDGKTSVDVGEEPFGLWVKGGKRTTFTDDALNPGPTKHAARVYPLKARGGGAIADALLVCFEEADSGDYNDYVFVLWNARPAP